jgi:3-phenylpropionate/trans-cinnamate dioxygenase ferredoxin reductase component
VDHVVIVGAGQAGVQVADSLRSRSYDGEISLLGDEPVLPYQRPPLSKDYLAADGDPGALPLRAERFFIEQRIDLRTGVQVTAIDRHNRTVVLDRGEELSYSELVLATGAANRTLPVPGADLAGVHVLRTLADAEHLRAALTTARSAVVVGAGFIGLEFAAAARKRGVEVTVLEAAERAMARALSPEMARHLTGAHRGMGTDLRLGEGLAAFRGSGGRVVAAVGRSGHEHPADLVVLAVGVRPRDELARAAGLAVDDGIVVDEQLRTTDPHVYAVGDCASAPGDVSGARLRLESVQNATDQGRRVADAIVSGAAGSAEVPWFWSNQGPLRLQIAGLRRPDDDAVVAGDVAGGRFSVFCFRDDRLVAVESLNRPADHMAARRVLATGTHPTREQVADPRFSLKDHAKQLAVAG